jgi:signal transduction histidine kinase
VANDWTDVRQDLKDRLEISALTGFVTLIAMVALIAVAVRRYISRPLAELSRRVISFSTDEAAPRFSVRDEVELLIGEFRKLGEELARARADLLEKHRSEIELERRLLHSDRLATIGSLATGLAHEIGTPMGVIQQVFVNLGINALDAMRTTGGTLSVAARIEHDNGASRITLVFEDTGPGIPEPYRERIFDPFFTTKEPGEGTGMGLAVCQTIVQSHNGNIAFESSPAGTRFFVSFPRSQRPPVENIVSMSAIRNGHE